jgi:methyltransferase
MIVLAYAIIGILTIQRVLELYHSNRNTKALLARGAMEYAPSHYPFIVLLHVCWLAALPLLLPRPFVMHWWALGAFVLFQALRIWMLISLGPYFTTRIISLDGQPLVRRGPYRFMRHPNYLIVAGEIASMPLALGETTVAIVFSILNAGLLAWRIRAEDRALASRRQLSPDAATNP